MKTFSLASLTVIVFLASTACKQPSITYNTEFFLQQRSEDQKSSIKANGLDANGYYSYDGFDGILIRIANKTRVPQPENRSTNPYYPSYLKYEHVYLAMNLITYMEKCACDSRTFSKILQDVAKTSKKYGQPLSIQAFRGHQGIEAVSLSNSREELYVDLNDLEIFPNPIKSKDTGLVEQLSGHPEWAEFLCSVLGHELAEMTAIRNNKMVAKKAGKKYDIHADRQNHHYQVANPASDRISKDYFLSNRVRGADCERDHIDKITGAKGDHKDILIEIKPDRVIIIHKSPPVLQFGTDLEERLGKIYGLRAKYTIKNRREPSRYSDITYEENFNFQKNCSN